MTDNVHDITKAKKSRKPEWLTRKNALKATALTVFGGAVALVAYDKVANRGSQDIDTEESDTTES